MANEDYKVIVFDIRGEKREVLLASISDWPFNGFEEKENELLAYLAEKDISDSLFDDINSICNQYDCSWSEKKIPHQNWNALWESSFQAVKVGNFVGVRADFHPPFSDVQYELLIHPRMAFGTGHHATTYLVMQRMAEVLIAGKTIFDYGCGTGILAILASKLGASKIEAVDIEEEATANTLVNMTANKVDDITVFTGDLSAVPPQTYDVILANINRNVILNTLGALYQRTKRGGHLLISGILEQDRERVEKEALRCGFQQLLVREREGWLMLHYTNA